MLSELSMSTARALLLTFRPHQWVKNLFAFVPLVFAKQLGSGAAAARESVAVLVFCALSSAVYAMNDVLDVERDRAHPTKRRRPVASGALSQRTARRASVALAAAGLVLASCLAWELGAIALAYLALNAGYSLRLKEIPFVDVASITAGFLLRVLGGSYAVSVPPSTWLLVCTGLLAAFLGFGKRSHELAHAADAGRTRRVLRHYRRGHLRTLLVALAVATVVAYAAYTQADHTVAFFGTRRLVWTVPFCVAGIARFHWLVVTVRPGSDSPTDVMLRDVPFLLNLLLWGAAVLGIIYHWP